MPFFHLLLKRSVAIVGALVIFLTLALTLSAQIPDPKSPVLADEEGKPLPTPPPVNKVLADSANPEVSPTGTPARPSVLDNNVVIAFYGNPNSKKMGILGENEIDEMAANLVKVSQEWVDVSKPKKILPAFHLIFATVNADASLGFLSDKTIQKYVDYAAQKGYLVILDHQLGKYTIETAMKAMLPWLKFPNVHLAIDPEWKTLTPGVTLGTIQGEDINKAQQMMEEYMEAEGIQDRRMLIIHQFNARMILNRDKIKANFERIDLVHHADGFGQPAVKLDTYQFLSTIKNIPIKGFKLFYPKPWKTKGFDSPMLTPKEVMALKPQPVFISYQ